VRTLVVLTFLAVTLYGNHENSKLYGQQAPEPPLFGLWEVEEFALDGKVRPPLTTDAGRWQRVTFNKAFTLRKSKPGKPRVGITNMPGKFVLFAEVEVDEEKQTITLTRPGGPPGDATPPTVHVLRYHEVEPEGEGPAAALREGQVPAVEPGLPLDQRGAVQPVRPADGATAAEPAATEAAVGAVVCGGCLP
jgi:hypothetical protein